MEPNSINPELITAVSHSIGLGDYRVGVRPDNEEHWVIYGLGSCIGLILFDWQTGISGIAHIVLPDHKQFPDASAKPAKFATTAVPFLLREMEHLGARKISTRSYIVGGACMLNLADIGAKNTECVIEVLQEHGIPIVGKSVGGNQGRTLLWDPKSKKATVNRVGAVEIVLLPD